MTEIKFTFDPETEVQQLKNEIALLIINPDAALNYESEEDRTLYINNLKDQLIEHGIDANQFQAEVVRDHFGIKVPLDNVVDFSRKAS